MKFADLGLTPEILQAVQQSGYENPSDVQLQAIPALLKGHDLLVSAQTGSGKTAAFLLPSLVKINNKSPEKGMGPRVLVLTPTRELAQQVEKNALTYGANLKWLRTACLVGGSSFGIQIRAMSRPVDIMVATPGRLMDHMRSGRVDFSRLEVLVLDEADRMLDMGFIDDIETIVAATPANRQTVLFSATLDGTVGKLALSLTRDPVRIEIERKEDAGSIEEHLLYCDDMRHKNRLLDHILKESGYEQMIIFTATKVFSEELADQLHDQGYAAACLHGDMPQSWRNRTIQDLHRGRIRILVATDVAARGIDVSGITHVINYDLPKQAEDYVHRIGRTGRAGRSGIALTLADSKEFHKVRRIEQYLKRTIAEAVIEGIEPTRRPPKGPRPSKPGSRSHGGRGSSYGGGGSTSGRYDRNARGGRDPKRGNDGAPSDGAARPARDGAPRPARDGARAPRDGARRFKD